MAKGDMAQGGQIGQGLMPPERGGMPPVPFGQHGQQQGNQGLFGMQNNPRMQQILRMFTGMGQPAQGGSMDLYRNQVMPPNPNQQQQPIGFNMPQFNPNQRQY